MGTDCRIHVRDRLTHKRASIRCCICRRDKKDKIKLYERRAITDDAESDQIRENDFLLIGLYEDMKQYKGMEMPVKRITMHTLCLGLLRRKVKALKRGKDELL